jgi:DNA-binding CsgD family transcriptional regulator
VNWRRGCKPPDHGYAFLVATAPPRATLREDVLALLHRGLTLDDYARAVTRILRRSVAFDGVCLLTMDPSTVLPTREFVENGLPEPAFRRQSEIELGDEPDFNKFRWLSHAASRAGTLSAATEGHLDRSARHREVRGPSGFGDELRAALVDDTGTWGALTLLREAGTSDFTAEDARLVSAVSAHLAEGIRRALLVEGLSTAGAHDPVAGLLILADDGSVETADATGQVLLEELSAGREPDSLPPAIPAVAHRARALAAGERHDGPVARVRVRTDAGRWLLVHGSVFGDGAASRTAVIVEPARSPELAPLIAGAYGLTGREREITELVARGLQTNAIAHELGVSPYTVQDHVKAVFEKVDVTSRGELVARLFLDHYAPRLG